MRVPVVKVLDGEGIIKVEGGVGARRAERMQRHLDGIDCLFQRWDLKEVCPEGLIP